MAQRGFPQDGSETAQDAFKRAPRRPDALKRAPRRPTSTPKASRRFPRDRPNHVPGRRSGNMIPRCRPAFERYLLLPRRPGGRPNHAPGTLSGNMIPHADPSPRSHRYSLPAPAFFTLATVTPTASRRPPRDRPNHVPGPPCGNMISRCLTPRLHQTNGPDTPSTAASWNPPNAR